MKNLILIVLFLGSLAAGAQTQELGRPHRSYVNGGMLEVDSAGRTISKLDTITAAAAFPNRPMIGRTAMQDGIAYYHDGTAFVRFSGSGGPAGVPTSRTITAGTGLSGGGDLSADRTISLTAQIAAGSCTNCNLTYNAQGQITVAANGTGGSSGGLAGSGTSGNLTAWNGTGSVTDAPATYSGNNIAVTGIASAGLGLRPTGGIYSPGAGTIVYEVANAFGLSVMGKYVGNSGNSSFSLFDGDGNGRLYLYGNRTAWPNTGMVVNQDALNASAVFEAVSTSKGLLGPRMTTAQRDAIVNPAEGLEIYNLTTHFKNVFNGTSWKEIPYNP